MLYTMIMFVLRFIINPVGNHAFDKSLNISEMVQKYLKFNKQQNRSEHLA